MYIIYICAVISRNVIDCELSKEIASELRSVPKKLLFLAFRCHQSHQPQAALNTPFWDGEIIG